MGRLDGKRAVVTGGASGIGRATAQLMAREGASVLLCDLDDERAAAAAPGMGGAAAQVLGVGCDVADPRAVELLFDVAEAPMPATAHCRPSPSGHASAAGAKAGSEHGHWLEVRLETAQPRFVVRGTHTARQGPAGRLAEAVIATGGRKVPRART